MDGNRVLFWDNTPLSRTDTGTAIVYSKNYPIAIRSAEGTPNEWWYWDAKTESIRSKSMDNLVLSFDDNKRTVAHPWTEADNGKLVYDKSSHQLKGSK